MSWLAVFVGFSLLIIVHEGGHFLVAKATGMRVERFFLFFGPTIWSFRRGETEYGVKAIPLGGYVKITGMTPEEEVPPEHRENAYFRKPVWRRIAVVAAGPFVNIVLAFLILFAVYLVSGGLELRQSVGVVESGSPAAKVLQPGDRIVAVDGRSFRGLSTAERLERFGRIVGSHRCAGRQVQGCVAATPVRIEVRRQGVTKTFVLYPRYDRALDRTRLGFAYGSKTVDLGVARSASLAGEEVWRVTTATVHLITHLFESEQREQVSGVVGISDVGHQVVERSFERSMLLLALVSLSLGLINLLPILPLDGGHIFWALVEKVRGRPASLRLIASATAVGMVLVAALVFIGLSNDISRITGEGFEVR